jgi:hypothetical protein
VAKGRRYNVWRLKDRSTKSLFSEKLRENLQNVEHDGTVESRWNSLKDAFKNTSEEVLGYEQATRKEWLSLETWKIVEERRQAKLKVCENQDQAKAQELETVFNNLNKEVKRSARRDKQRFMENLAEEAQEAANKGHLSELYKITRKLTQAPSRPQMPVKDKDGRILVAVEEQLARWKEHFQEILNRPCEAHSRLERRNVPELQVATGPPSKSEILKALKELKGGKAAGIDNIPVEILKADATLTVGALHPLFQDIWNTETLPKDWLQGVIVKIPKKGDLANCKNWRGISLLCIVSKVLSKIILNRIISVLEPHIRRQQAGFRSGRSCVDHVNTLRMIVEQSVEQNSPLFMLFVDYQVAFDSLDRECIWIALKNRGLPDKIINIIRQLYNEFQCCVMHDGQLTEPFITVSGVRQGCILSPLLFLVVLDEVLMNSLDVVKGGISWKLTETLEDLDYADDIVLLSHKRENLQKMLDSLVFESEKVGLKVNVEKTKDVRLKTNSNVPFKINGEDIVSVFDFCYLGSNVSADGGGLRDVELRINKARGAFFRLKNIWSANNISNKLKIRIFNSCVKSVLLYGCETWFVTTDIMSKLQTFVNRCLRYIMKIWWPAEKISNQELWRRTDQADINLEIRRRKYGWIGHTLRKDHNEVCHGAIEWNPPGKMKRGRPKTTWRRSVLKECGKKSFGEIRALAKERRKWKSFVDGLCSEC